MKTVKFPHKVEKTIKVDLIKPKRTKNNKKVDTKKKVEQTRKVTISGRTQQEKCGKENQDDSE